MNEQSYFHWDLFRPPIHSPSFTMGASFLDIREDAMRGIPGKSKPFSFDQSCALWSKDFGLDPSEGIPNVGGRVLEIRKEKSRDAARSRRGKENYEFYELAKLLPLPAAITSQLDKASIIRLSISYLKLRDFCGHGDPPWNLDGQNNSKALKGQRRNSGIPVELFDIHQGAHILQSLDGFAFALSNDGRFIYISETVSIYLGLSQVEMAGCSIFDYVHSQDHQELADQLGLPLASVSSTLSSPASPSVDSPTNTRAITPPVNDRVPIMSPGLEKTATRSFCIRMKSTLTKRGVHSRSSGYRVVLFVGQFRSQVNFSIGRKCQGPLLGLCGTAIALPPPTITELRIEADTFIMRLTAQFKIIYCENVISTLTDWRCEDVIGRDLYELCHPADANHMKKLHKDLLMKGQVMSPSIKLLNKGGGYIWLCVCCTSLYSSKTSDDQTVLAIFQTISNIEYRGVAMDASQLSYTEGPTVTQRNTGEDIDNLIREERPPSSQTSDRSDNIPISTHNSPEPVTETGHVTSPGTPSVFPSGVDNDFLLDENIETDNEPVKVDSKMSRRKTDRPRKRRRDSDESQSVSTLLETIDKQARESCVSGRTISLDGIGDHGSVLNLSSGHHSLPNSPELKQTATSQQTPEDLSLRPDSEKRLDAKCFMKKDSSGVSKPNNIGSSSVHELEKAMNRHLPVDKKSFHETAIDNHGGVPTQKSSIHWLGASTSETLQTPFSSPFCVNNLYTSRESVIRSSLRSQSLNGESNVINMLSAPSGEVSINKDQLQLHIPHISITSKHNFHPQKDSVSHTDEFGISPPGSVSPQDKMAASYQEIAAPRDCMSMRIGQRHDVRNAANKQFSTVDEPGHEMSKSPFIPVPNYQYHPADVANYSQGSSTLQSGGLFDPRNSSGNIWYGSSYNS